MKQIVAVGMLDPLNTGRDIFFVQLGEDSVMQYEAKATGEVKALWPNPEPMATVDASIERYNRGYRVETPVTLQSIDELPKYVGKFDIIDEVTCIHVPQR